eukprot:TRINITY_DN5046_c0_g2_i1.p1 TRINITY_DN5046_c0_g2~~TRINITY_DN5046_c0_g2_i1.p1  ORF type:complete len:493 (-),score=70.79 TRINITY_DN5046_c0_g2_i1:118-1575(-)
MEGWLEIMEPCPAWQTLCARERGQKYRKRWFCLTGDLVYWDSEASKASQKEPLGCHRLDLLLDLKDTDWHFWCGLKESQRAIRKADVKAENNLHRSAAELQDDPRAIAFLVLPATRKFEIGSFEVLSPVVLRLRAASSTDCDAWREALHKAIHTQCDRILMEGIQSGDIEKVGRMLQQGAQLTTATDQTDGDESMPILTVAVNKDHRIAALLMQRYFSCGILKKFPFDRGFPMDTWATGSDGKTPFMHVIHAWDEGAKNCDRDSFNISTMVSCLKAGFKEEYTDKGAKALHPLHYVAQLLACDLYDREDSFKVNLIVRSGMLEQLAEVGAGGVLQEMLNSVWPNLTQSHRKVQFVTGWPKEGDALRLRDIAEAKGHSSVIKVVTSFVHGTRGTYEREFASIHNIYGHLKANPIDRNKLTNNGRLSHEVVRQRDAEWAAAKAKEKELIERARREGVLSAMSKEDEANWFRGIDFMGNPNGRINPYK